MVKARNDDPTAAPLPTPSLAFLLIALGRHAHTLAEQQLASTSLGFHHFSALGHLSRDPGLSYSELGRRAGVTAQSMQVTVNRLESVGAVERVGQSGRGRRADLRVTEHGRVLLAAGFAAMRGIDDQLWGDMASAQRRAVLGFLAGTFTSVVRDDSSAPAGPSEGI